MAFNLDNHPIWHEYAEILENLDLNLLVESHLQACNYKVIGYQDEDTFYDEIQFITPINAEFISSSLGIEGKKIEATRWITLNFLLKASISAQESTSFPNEENQEIAELTLIFDSSMTCIDENWLIYIESPFVLAKQEKDLLKVS